MIEFQRYSNNNGSFITSVHTKLISYHRRTKTRPSISYYKKRQSTNKHESLLTTPENTIKRFRCKAPFSIDYSIPNTKEHRIRTSYIETRRSLVSGDAPQTKKENSLMREKMKEYESYSKNVGLKTVKLNISFIELNVRLNRFAGRIKSLLQREEQIENIDTEIDYNVKITMDTRKHYKVKAKMEQIPFKIYMEVEKGIGNSRAMFSRVIPKLTIDNCDKMVNLSSKNVAITYEPNTKYSKVFTEEYIYINFETYTELSLIFQCAFGNSKYKLTIENIKLKSHTKVIKRSNIQTDNKLVNGNDNDEFSDSEFSNCHSGRSSATRMKRISPKNNSVNYESRKMKVKIGRAHV